MLTRFALGLSDRTCAAFQNPAIAGSAVLSDHVCAATTHMYFVANARQLGVSCSSGFSFASVLFTCLIWLAPDAAPVLRSDAQRKTRQLLLTQAAWFLQHTNVCTAQKSTALKKSSTGAIVESLRECARAWVEVCCVGRLVVTAHAARPEPALPG